MMKRSYILLSGIISMALLSCDKKSDALLCEEFEEITFGSFYGECGGEGCVEIFRIEKHLETVTEDVNDDYPRADQFYDGHFILELPVEKYGLVEDLMDHFPQALLNETGTVLGNPDGGDWGGIYFEIRTEDTHRFWLLDTMHDNMPAVYNEFVDRIQEKLILLH